MSQQLSPAALIGGIAAAVVVVGGVVYFVFFRGNGPVNTTQIPTPAAAQHMSRPVMRPATGGAPTASITGTPGMGGAPGPSNQNTAPVGMGGTPGPGFQNVAPVK